MPGAFPSRCDSGGVATDPTRRHRRRRGRRAAPRRQARKEAADRRTEPKPFAVDLRERDLSCSAPCEEAAEDRVRAAREPGRRLEARTVEPQQHRTAEQTELGPAVALPRPDDMA